MNGIRQILWDWNGTLLNDVQYAIDVRNRVFPDFGLPTITRSEYYEQFTFPVRTYYERAGVTDEIFDAVAHGWMAEYCRGFATVPLYEDTRATLGRFQEAGLSQSVLSATQRDMLAEQLNQFGLLPFFDHVLGLSDIYAKSKIAVGQAYLKESAIPAENTLLIGDSLHDAEVAQALGIRCLLVTRGHQTAQKLAQAGVPLAPTLAEAARRVLGGEI